MFKPLYIGSTSVCFELNNDLIYYNDLSYQIIVDGVKQSKEFNANVFSLFDLLPNTSYIIGTTLNDFCFELITAQESCCINVMDFGAIGDGHTDDTLAVQNAINACSENGRVLFPQGIYYTRPITLKSNITIELKKGAKMLASEDEKDYPIIPGEIECEITKEKIQYSSWEGHPMPCYQSYISAHFAKNIKIIGEGLIDGNGHSGIWYPDFKKHKYGRPRLLFLNKCEDIVIHGITGQNSASWNFHPYFCNNISFFDIKVFADKDSPNTDGCNPESCNNVKIIGSLFSVGDDCVALKSGKIYMGKTYKTPCQNVIIRNCIMQYGHGAIVLGSELAGGIKNLSISRCYFNQTDRGLRIKTRRGRGVDAIVDNIIFENIKMDNVLSPIVVNMFYFCDPDGKTEYVWSKEKLPVDECTPYIGRCHFKDMVCNDCEQTAGFFYGLPEQPIKEIIIENVKFSFKQDSKPGLPAMMTNAMECCKHGLYFNNVENVKLKNVSFNDVKGDTVIKCNVNNIEIE